MFVNKSANILLLSIYYKTILSFLMASDINFAFMSTCFVQDENELFVAMCIALLLTYLIGHNNPINGFRPAATHSSRRLCSLRAYASWLPLFGLSNGCKVVLLADFRRSPHQIPVSPEYPPPYEQHGRASAAAGY